MMGFEYLVTLPWERQLFDCAHDKQSSAKIHFQTGHFLLEACTHGAFNKALTVVGAQDKNGSQELQHQKIDPDKQTMVNKQ